MGLWDSVKQALGFTGVKVELDLPDTFSRGGQLLAGAVVLNAARAQRVMSLEWKLVEERTVGALGSGETNEIVIGTLHREEEIELSPGETRIPFELPYTYQASDLDELREKGGVLGAVAGFTKKVSFERSKYKVTVVVEIQGTLLDPEAERAIQLTD